MPAEFIYGIHPVCETLGAGRREIKRIIIARGSSPQKAITLAKSRNIEIEFGDKNLLRRLTGTDEHQGIVAEASPYPYSSVDELLEVWAISGKKAFFLILDSIEDPHNLGAIVRSAYLFGVLGIFIPEHRSAKVTPSVVKASSGAVEHMKVAVVKSLNSLIGSLKKEGLRIIALSESGESLLDSVDYKTDIALIIGSEGRGIASTRESACDHRVRIPTMVTGFSYNASVAASIAMYEVVRQRTAL